MIDALLNSYKGMVENRIEELFPEAKTGYSEVSKAKGNTRKVVTMPSRFFKLYVLSAFAQLLQREKALGLREQGVLFK